MNTSTPMMDTNPLQDMREYIAMPKRWQAKANPPVPFKEYPKMPLVHHRDSKGVLTGKADVPLYDTKKQPIIFQNAREEADWLEAHPREAEWIAEAKMDAIPAADKLAATSDHLRATQDRLKGSEAELEAKDGELSEALAQLAAAKAELAAAKAAKQSGDKIDKRTKEYREAHKPAAE